MTGRTDALINGAVIAFGSAAILDNLFSHWLLGLHRAVPGSAATPIELALFLTGALAVGIGVRREMHARRREAATRPAE
jgi:hypothetical protein